MKKTNLYILFLLLPVVIHADTLFDYGGDRLSEWKVEASYSEKYFEHNIYYIYYNLFDDTYIDDGQYEGSLLRGMKHNFLIRCGLPGDSVINMDFLYIYQRLGEFDYNNLHNVSLFWEKFFKNGAGLLAGVKIPFDYEMPDDVRFIDSRGKSNAVAGGFYRGESGILSYSASLVFEKDVTFSSGYEGEINALCSTGLKVYETKDQSVDFILEAAYNISRDDGVKQSSLYFVPQARVDFYNDFYFLLGVEILAYAENMFLNKFFIEGDKKIFYLAQVNYVINSDIREQKEEEKEEEVKSWKEQDIDPEMIPSFWLEDAKIKEGGEGEGKTDNSK